MKTPTQTKSFPIPDYWTAEQALAAYELLSDLMDLVWDAHHEALLRLYRQEALGALQYEADIAEVHHDFDHDIPL